MGTQMGKTASMFNIIGRKLDDDPAPVLYVGPTKSNLENVIEPQLSSMLNECASLKAKMPRAQKKLKKSVAGVSLRLAWAGSPTELASQPAHTVVVDERDKMAPIPGEGDPVTLAVARIATYPDGKLFVTSSPTEGTVQTYIHPDTGMEHWQCPENPEDVVSPIWRAWQEGTRHEWAVPCVHCEKYFVPRFKLLKWPEKSTPRQAMREAKLCCPNCGGLMDETHKKSMNDKGQAIAPGQKVVDGAVIGSPPDSDNFSLWVSGLMSPWVTFGQRAASWLLAVSSGDQERIRAELNTSFGELYQLRGQAPEWKVVKALGAHYRMLEVPAAVRKLFLTADVQKDHLVCVVRGWAPEFRSWMIHAEELWGDTDKPEVFGRLGDLSQKMFGGRPIDAIAIDSGFRTDQVYSFCYRRGIRAYATKGQDRPRKLYSATDVEVDRKGRRLWAGMKVWILDHSYFKSWVHDRLLWPQDQPGAWHLPVDVPDDYCRQLVAEQRMRLPSGGVQWVKSGVNDYLDCEALQAFLAHVEGIRTLRPDSVPSTESTLEELGRSLNG